MSEPERGGSIRASHTPRLNGHDRAPECPLDRIPYGDPTGPHNEPNAFGLRIAHDTYSSELTGDASVRGGDGGESVCGGYGRLLGWLPLATAHANPGLVEFVYGEDGDDLYEDLSTRPVLAL